MSQLCFFRYRPVSAQVFGTRLTKVNRHYDNLLRAHSNDPTGAAGEDTPSWFDVYQRFRQYVDNQSVSGRARENRANLRAVQETLGAVQPPLGPGNPPLRSEIAADNPEQVRGPIAVGVGLQVNEVVINQEADSNPGEDNSPAEDQTTRRRRRTREGGNTRRNRQRTGGRTIQDDINEGRENIGRMASALNELAQAVANPQQPIAPPVVHPLAANPIESLRVITQNVLSIAHDLDPERERNMREELMNSWTGTLRLFNRVNGLDQNGSNPTEGQNNQNV